MQPHEIWIEPRRQLDQYFFVRQVVHGASYPQTRFSYYTPAARLASPAISEMAEGGALEGERLAAGA